MSRDTPGSDRFTCKVRTAGRTDPPQDCNWPFCGCDPYADKVVESISESGRLLDDAYDAIQWLNDKGFSLMRGHWLNNEIIWRIVAHDGRGQIAHGKTAMEAYSNARQRETL